MENIIKNVVLACEDRLLPEFIQWLDERYTVERVGCLLGENQLIRALHGADALIMAGGGRITEGLNALYPNVVYIFVGIEDRTYFDENIYDSIVQEGRIYRTGGGQEAVAQTTLEQIRCFSQMIQIEIARKFRIAPSAEELLRGQTVAIIGAGGIGQLVMKKAAKLCGRVIYTGGRGEKPELEAQGFEYVPVIGDAIEQAQIVTTHLEFIPGVTEGVIRYEDLMKIPAGGLFINNARAGLVSANGLLMFLIDRPDVTVRFDHFHREGKEYTDLDKFHHDTLYKIIKQENFGYTGHTAAQREPTFKEYSENLRRILETMQKGA